MGRLRYFMANWLNITQHPIILQIVQGFQIQFHSFPVQRTLPRPLLQIGRRGNRNVVAQGCNTTGAFQQTRVLPQNVFGCKERWRSTCSFRPQSFKQIYPDRTLQNGKSHDNKNPQNQRGLYDKYRSDRCISNCTYTPLLTKISSFFMARSVLSVCNNAVWPQCGTKSIYKVNETPNILASGSGCSHDYLFR